MEEENQIILKLRTKKHLTEMVCFEKNITWENLLKSLQKYHKNATGVKFFDTEKDLIFVSSEEEWSLAINHGIKTCELLINESNQETTPTSTKETKTNFETDLTKENKIIENKKPEEDPMLILEKDDNLEFQKFLVDGANDLASPKEYEGTMDFDENYSIEDQVEDVIFEKEKEDELEEMMEESTSSVTPTKKKKIIFGDEIEEKPTKYSIKKFSQILDDIQNKHNQEMLVVALERKKKRSNEGFKHLLVSETQNKDFYEFIHEYQPKGVKKSVTDEEVYKMFVEIEKTINSLSGIKMELKRKINQKEMIFKDEQIESARVRRESECLKYVKRGENGQIFHKEALAYANKKLEIYFQKKPQMNEIILSTNPFIENQPKIIENVFIETIEEIEPKSSHKTSNGNKSEKNPFIEFEELKPSKKKEDSKKISCQYESNGYCRYTNLKFSKNMCEYQHSFKRPSGKYTFFDLSQAVSTTVSTSFTQTFPGARIIKIKGIHNDTLFKLFKSKESEITSARGKPNIRSLFHGTNLNILDNIYKSGFILRKISNPLITISV
jgi:hypothetical protein